MTGARLVLDGIRKGFGGGRRPALDGIDLDVEGGTILVLLGTSGAGKTTLLRIVAGLEVADEGRVLVGDRLLSDPAVRVAPEHRRVGLVFQHLELWPHMTIAENIAFGLPGRPQGRRALRNATVNDLAERVGVTEMLPRLPGTLSGGERQRVAIARTLAPDPDVILYDEPLANLDPERRADLRRLIRTLCREHEATLLYVTHDAEEAMALGDEVAVLHRGRVVDRGAPAPLYARPSSVAAARALGPVNVLDATPVDGGVATVLGRLEVTGAVPGESVVAFVRPEAVEIGGDVSAEVVEAHPRGGRWTFSARLEGGTLVEGRASEELEAGRRVGLGVSGVVACAPSRGMEEEEES